MGVGTSSQASASALRWAWAPAVKHDKRGPAPVCQMGSQSVSITIYRTVVFDAICFDILFAILSNNSSIEHFIFFKITIFSIVFFVRDSMNDFCNHHLKY
jgi:hypothetical protein